MEGILKLVLIVEQLNTSDFYWLNNRAIQILCQYYILKNEDGILSFRHNKVLQYYKLILNYSPKDYINIFHDLENAYEQGAIAKKIICLYRSSNIDRTKKQSSFF